MSKAEELAKLLEDDCMVIGYDHVSAHLRALDASHRRLQRVVNDLQNALWKACGDNEDAINACIESQGGDPVEIIVALEQAKGLE